MTVERKKEILDGAWSGFLRSWLPILLASIAGGIAYGELRTDVNHNSERAKGFAGKEEVNRLLYEISAMDARQREILTILARIDAKDK